MAFGDFDVGGRRRRWRSASKRAGSRRLRLECLERRQLLALASVTHIFREDEFTWAGTLKYTVTQPDYTASIPSANFTGTGTVYWESPNQGQFSYDGSVTGSGTDRRKVGTLLRDCSSFTVEESGLFDLTLDGAAKTVASNFAISNSATYTQYTDRSGGSCPQGDAPSLYFGGVSEGYSGVFNPSAHTLTLNYDDTETGVKVVSPATTTASPSTLVWSETANTDFSVTLAAQNGEPTLPESWISLAPPAEFTAETTTLDPKFGRLQITLTANGKPAKALTGGVTLPVGNIQVQWASAATTSAQLQTIPVSSIDNLFGAHWNTREMSASVSELGAIPSWAKFVKVTVTAAGFTESITANNSAFIPIKTFEAKTGPTLTTAQDDMLMRFAAGDSVLEATDLARFPNVAVSAFNTSSRLGAAVFISDAGGGFNYDPTTTPSLLALAAGETADDAIEFLAIENGTYIDDVIRPIRVVGVNDPPTASEDAISTSESTIREISTASLLANDSDVDRGDSVRFFGVETTSQLGATITIRENGAIAYDPTNAILIRSMRQGESRQDSFQYTIVDKLGLEGTGVVMITLSGTNDPPRIAPIEPAIFSPGATNAITNIQIGDFDTDLSQVSLAVSPQPSSLLAAGNIAMAGTGENRLVTLTPNAGVTGRVRLTAQATSAAPESATGTQSFFLVAGTAADTDLDGVPNAVESSAFVTSDSNNDGITDQSQPYLAALRSVANDLALRLESPKSSVFANVAALGTASGAPANTTTPWGGVSYELHTVPGSTVTIVFASDSSQTLNTFYLTAPTPGGTAGATTWQWLMWNGIDGARVYADRVEWVVRDGGRGDADGQANGVITGAARPAKTASPWRNQILAEDVNNVGGVQPIDALLVINYLNSSSPRALPETIAANVATYPIFIDVSGDNFVSPIDALRVINRLNGVTGEAESSYLDDRLESLSLPEIDSPEIDSPEIGSRGADPPPPISPQPATPNSKVAVRSNAIFVSAVSNPNPNPDPFLEPAVRSVIASLSFQESSVTGRDSSISTAEAIATANPPSAATADSPTSWAAVSDEGSRLRGMLRSDSTGDDDVVLMPRTSDDPYAAYDSLFSCWH